MSLSGSIWVYLCRLTSVLRLITGATFHCLPTLSPTKEPRALHCRPHVAQRNPNVLCSLCEDFIAATLLALKDMIWLVTWTLIRGSPRWGDQLFWFAAKSLNFCNEKFSSPNPSVLGLIGSQYLVLTQENSTMWDGCLHLALLLVTLTIHFDFNYLFGSIGMQLELTPVLCSN